jgi:hypothetical protein
MTSHAVMGPGSEAGPMSVDSRPVVQLTRRYASAFPAPAGAGFMILPCASRCRDATDQAAGWRDL